MRDFFRNQSIQRKMTLIITLSSAVVLVLACAAFVGYDQINFSHSMVDDLSLSAASLAEGSAVAIQLGSEDTGTSTLAALKFKPHIVAAAIYKKDGSLLAKYPATIRPSSVPDWEGHRFVQGQLVFVQATKYNDSRNGTLYIASDLVELRARLRRYLSLAGVFFIVAFVLVLPLSRRMQRLISAPILDLAQAARVVADDKNYSVRATKQGDDEVGFLIDRFNEMLAQIEKREKELHEVNAALSESEQRAQAATQAKSQFLANMSHELRTPLNAIIGFSEILGDKTFGELNDKQAKYIKNILTSGRHLLQLINDILDLAKIEAGKLELDRMSFQVATAIDDVQTIVRTLANRKQITLMAHAEPDLPPLFADQPKVKQVLYNLLSNAIKFTPDGGRITVTAGLATPEQIAGARSSIPAPRAAGYLRVSVSDSGIGIKPEDQERVFVEFEQADSSYARQQHGTGLGLSLTRKLVEMHGGCVWVESEGVEGQGSNFIFLLPIDAEEIRAEKPKRETATEPIARPMSDGDPAEKPLVLVVEDERQGGELLEEYLANDGYRVAHAWDGEQAVQMARRLRPYAITLDILLPKKSGWDVLAELKAMPETKDIPVVIVSVSDDLQLGFSLGAIEYLVKPVSKDRLLEVVRKARTHNGQAVQTVLVVDDEPMTLEFVAHTIQEAGFKVRSATSGKEGIELATREPPDLVVLDLMMPEMSGFEVVQKLRAQVQTRDIPILIYTAQELTDADRKRLVNSVQSITAKSGKDELLRELRRLAAQLQPRQREISRNT